MSVRRVRKSFLIDTNTRLSTMIFLFGCSQEYRYFDFSLIESIHFNAYVRKIFRYENLEEVYYHPLLLHSKPVQPEKIEQLMQKCKEEILAYEQESKLIPLLKHALERLNLVSPMDFGAVVASSDDEWRSGSEKDNGFHKAFSVFRNTLVGDGSIDDYPDWFGCRTPRMRAIKIIDYIQNNPKATLEGIQDCVKCKANFHDCKDIKYELSTLEKELSKFEKAIAEQEKILLNEVEKAKRKDRHFGITIVISIFAAVMWQSMNHWWLGVVTFPMIGYLCFVCSLLKEKKNLVWKNCLSLHKKFCDTLKSYITKHKIW